MATTNIKTKPSTMESAKQRRLFIATFFWGSAVEGEFSGG